MGEPVVFKIGRKGILYLLRENGRRQKCGIRFVNGHIEVFDHQTRGWHILPEQLTSQKGGVISIAVFDEEVQE